MKNKNSHYKLKKILGHGSMGIVYLGIDQETGEEVAIKKFQLHSQSNLSESLLRFKREADIISRFSHPNIIKVKNLVERSNHVYLVMDFFPGSNLKSFPLDCPINKKIQLMIQIADTFDYIHQQEIIHRDIKPHNILFSMNEHLDLRIIDFGLAYFSNFHDIRKDSSIVGSFAYISPEQTGFLRRPIDNRSDLYSLGATFYELLTGQAPFLEKNINKLIHKHLSETPQPPSLLVKDIPSILDEILLKLLKKEPEERYQTAYGLKQDLDELLTSAGKKSFMIGQKDNSFRLNYQIRIIGRDSELLKLRESYENMPDFILIKGRSGSGKSKLLTSFQEDIQSDENYFFTFRCEKSRMNIPFAPFSALLQDYFSHFSSQFIKDKILEQLPLHLTQLSAVFPFLSSYMPENNYFSSTADAPNQNTKNEILHSIFKLLALLPSLGKKIIFFIEDIHQIDNESKEILTNFKESLQDSKILLISSAREEESASLAEIENRSTILQLKFLEKNSIAPLISKILNTSSSLPHSLYERIFSLSLGNPFFILEIVKELHEKQILYNADFHWQVDSEKLKEFSFSQDLSALIIKRLSEMKSPLEKTTLLMAAVIGKQFSIELLEKLIRYYNLAKNKNQKITLEKIIQVIDKSRKSQLIKVDNSSGNGIYSFIHDKIMEMLLNNISEEEKRDLHLTCAVTIENSTQTPSNEDIYQLSYHYNETDDKDKMLYYNQKSYELAKNQYSYKQAAFYLKKVVDYHLNLNDMNLNLANQILELSYLLQLSGQIADSFPALEKAIDFMSKENHAKLLMELHLQLGSGYYFMNLIPKASQSFYSALEIAKKNNIEITSPYPFRLIGSLSWFSFELSKAIENLSLAIKYMGEDEWSQNNRLATHGLRGWAYVLLGEIENTKNDIHIIERDFSTMTNPLYLAQIYHAVSACYSWGALDYKKALEYSLLSYQNAEASNNLLFKYSSLFSRVLSYFYTANYDKVNEAIQQAWEISETSNISIGIMLFHAYECETLLLEKKHRAAYDKAFLYYEGEKRTQEIFQRMIFAKILCAYHLIENHLEEALRYAEEGLSLFEISQISLEGLPLLLLKNHICSLLKISWSLDIKLNQIVSQHEISQSFLERAQNWLHELLNIKTEINTLDASQSSYSATASVIKDKLQLDNVIKTSQIISSILDVEELLNKIVEKTVEATGAQRGMITIYTSDLGDIQHQKFFHTFSGMKDLEIPILLLEKVKQEKSDFLLSSSDLSLDFGKEITALGIKSLLCIPLLRKQTLIGILYLDSKLINNLFAKEDIELLKVFTSQAAISIENARLHEKMLEKARLEQEMQIAKDIQTSILPFVKDTEHYQIAAFMRTATEVGGDYYDLFMKELPYFGVFGDVSGHGLKSGLVMMMAEVAFNTMMRDNGMKSQELSELYQKINTALYMNIQQRLSQKSMIGRQYSSMYMTFRMFRFDHDGNFEIFGNDHAEPIICRQDSGEISTIPSTGFLLGIMEDAILDNQTHKFKLNPGDLLIFCSDGIAEGHKEPKQGGSSDHHREEFGEERINAIIQAHRKKTPDEIIEAIVAGLDSYIHAQEDDVTLLVIKKK